MSKIIMSDDTFIKYMQNVLDLGGSMFLNIDRNDIDIYISKKEIAYRTKSFAQGVKADMYVTDISAPVISIREWEDRCNIYRYIHIVAGNIRLDIDPTDISSYSMHGSSYDGLYDSKNCHIYYGRDHVGIGWGFDGSRWDYEE